MDRLLLVCLGSAIGGGLRYLTGQAAAALLGAAFPFGTLAVNVVGSYLIGLIMEVSLTTELIPPALRIFLTAGIMGGLTTYSTFNYETLGFLRDGAWALGITNLAGTLFACLAAGTLGLATGRLIAAS